MVARLVAVIGLVLVLLSCSERDEPTESEARQRDGMSTGTQPDPNGSDMPDAAEPVPANIRVPVFDKQQVPSSVRSREAVADVAPGLVYALRQQGLAYGSPVFLRIFKQERELEVWVQEVEGYKLFRTYDVAAMSGELGPKRKEGDRQAPEGFYYVPPSQMNPNSRFHLSFNLGYPNTYDRHHGRTGSALMVHGNRVSIGCFAMTDAKIEEIYALADAALRNGQPYFRVHIFPFRMTQENMARHQGSRWSAFWENLKAGYDYFETSRRVPSVRVRDGVYVFEPDGG